MSVPAAPKGSKAAGKRLWKALVVAYDFEEHEMALLRQAVRLVDTLEELDDLVASEGPVITTPSGQQKTHPALVEARQSRIALARVLAVLRLPAGEEDDQLRRPQRRSGARGIYKFRAVS